MKLSIVVPVFNEADNILMLLNEITQALQVAEAYEIIFVDDASTDNSAQVFADALQQIPNLRVLKHSRTSGQSRAVYTGVKAARYDIIATLDGDGQNDPADIPRLYQTLIAKQVLEPKLVMVAGWRQHRHDSAWRLFSSKLANTVRAALLGDNTPDTGCGLKVFTKDMFLSLPYFDHMHRFLPALVLRTGGQVISEPVNHRSRIKGQSKYGTLDRLSAGIIDLLGVMWLQRRARQTDVMEIKRDK